MVRPIALLFVFLAIDAMAFCWKLPCYGVISSQKSQAISAVNTAFNQLDREVENLDRAYKDYLAALEEQNKLLEDLKKIRAVNAVAQKNIVFLAKKNNRLTSNLIDALAEQSRIDEGIDEISHIRSDNNETK